MLFTQTINPQEADAKRAVLPIHYQRHLGGGKIEWRQLTGSGTRLVNTKITMSSLVGRTGILRLPPEGYCFAQEAFTYAILPPALSFQLQ